MELWRLDAGVATWRDGSTSINGLPVVTISSGSDLLAITATDNAASLGAIAERISALDGDVEPFPWDVRCNAVSAMFEQSHSLWRID